MDSQRALCSSCLSLFHGKLSRRDWTRADRHGVHHITALKFQSSVEQGCRICVFLWNTLADARAEMLLAPVSDKGFTTYSLTYWPSGIGDIKPAGPTVHLSFILSNYKYSRMKPYVPWSHTFQLFPIDVIEDLNSRPYNVGCSTQSDNTMKLVSQWLESCSQSHTLCNFFPNSRPFRYPTRLLYVGKHSNSAIRLCITAETFPTGNYATLSHCWGSVSCIKLLMSNIEHMKKEIQFNSLPKTFREAVEMAWRLQISYLWIDSMCVIQNSIEDWQRESAQMDSVYNNSYCNFAAAHSVNSEGGLFVTRDPSLIEEVRVETEWENLKKMKFGVYDGLFWGRRVNDAPLHRRGWVLQERILSRRIIHFGFDQILWECCEDSSCETYPQGIPEGIPAPRPPWKHWIFQETSSVIDEVKSRELGCDNTISPPHQSRAGPIHSYYTIWNNLVMNYSKCQLTREEDKLVAISGMAQRMHQVMNDIYLAGIWGSSLPHNLLWSVPSFSRASRPIKYRAPSWSWAALDGQIVTEYFVPQISLVEVLDYHVTAINNNPFSQIIDGYIRVSGRLYPAVVNHGGDRQYSTTFQDRKLSNTDFLTLHTLLDIVPETQSMDVYYLPVAIRKFERQGVPRQVYLLILRRVESSEQVVFTRLGTHFTAQKEVINIIQSLHDDDDPKAEVIKII